MAVIRRTIVHTEFDSLLGGKKQAIYVKRNVEARSCNQGCSGKAKSVTYTECVFVALSIQRAM